METRGPKRKLAAILNADIAGFSRSMERDEVGTHHVLVAHRQVTDPIIAGHGGRIVGTAGDSILADFASVVDALECAVAMQTALSERNATLPEVQRLVFRIGINLGDVIVDGADIFGDGVNIAARVQALAAPGGIAIAGSVYDQVRNKLDYTYRYTGSQAVKNISEPVRVYAVDWTMPAARPAGRRLAVRPWHLVGAALMLALAAGATFLGWDWSRRASEPGVAVSSTAPAQVPPSEIDSRPELGRTPVVAVLPFANRSGDSGQDYFSDGLTEDIITALGRFPGLSVIAGGAVFPYKGKAVPLEQISRELGARYLVEGSVRRLGDQIRVSAQLVDAGRGVNLWSEQFEEQLQDVFTVQDRITRSIVAMLAIRLEGLERERAASTPTANLTAYELVLRGRERQGRGTRSANLEAQRLFEQAAQLDPNYAAADVALGWALYEMVVSGWTEFGDAALERAEFLARRALSLDANVAFAHRLLGLIYMRRARFDIALGELDLAIRANPSDAEGHAARGGVLMFSGRPAEAVASIEAARRLNPTITSGSYMNQGFAHYFLRRYDDAVRAFEQGLVRDSASRFIIFSQIGLAAAYAQLDRQDEAIRAAEKARQLWPFFEGSIFLAQFNDPRQRAHLADGLSKAGLLQ